ncbi:Do family serine endopeptidase [Mucilaginibacter celer]|uniref:Do family serine endopeptidase n=1 Tax=Mucilaginibacter celer TaxID=2305508 RepID=A0A494W3Z4_9SPHI|nr:Do family serine endopeptidase [Mucilaginibacter celer]AYL98042.1 Do family serine endopeptidase [Mucilaginibacter celer]
MKKIGLTLLTAFVGGAMALGVYKVIENKYSDGLSFEDKQKVYFTSNPMPAVSSTGDLDFTQAAAVATPAVVYIRTTYSAKSNGGGQDQLEQMFGDMFGQRSRPQGPQMASGSGVIISPDGYIVTNNHVVEKADKITVYTNDHRYYSAKVIGTDPSTDLALIKVSAANLPIVKLGNSDDAKVGEWVLAVGNPFNLTSTVTAGIISAKGRNIGIIGSENSEDENPFGRTSRQTGPKLNKAIESFIQTDAAINPGNSGGALVNTRGELIGINAAIASHTGSYEGYGFAIPVNLAKKVLNDIKKFGTVKRGYVGVSFTELNPDNAKRLDITTENGLYVNDLVPGGGAEQAGIRKGDIIVKVEGQPVYESSDLQERVGRLQPGDKINITVLRDGKNKDFAVTLKGDAVAPSNRTAANSKSAEELFNKLGASFHALTPAEKNKLRVNSGVLVTQVREGGLFDAAEIPEGVVITSINKVPVSSIEDIDKAIVKPIQGNIIIAGLYPDGSHFSSAFPAQ